jgi:[glutamine synthetase] adenylyltransferase / [glutamine synthetase]-adenylyl-L-tyrosine phosphorylase
MTTEAESAQQAADRRGVHVLSRVGFHDGAQAEKLLSGPTLPWWDAEAARPTDSDAANAIAALGRSAEPDTALAALVRLVEAATAIGAEHELTQAIRTNLRLARRLLNLLGISMALADHLVANPLDWRVLLDDDDALAEPARAARIAASVGAGVNDPVTGTDGARAQLTGPAATSALRAAYLRELTAIAGRDLGGDLDLEAVTAALAQLADVTLQAGLAVAAAGLPADAAACRLAIIAMGKAGGRELNYVSDVDVVFVAEPGEAGDQAGLATATTLASETMKICRVVAWEVDAALRPEGRDGPLVRTLASHEAYYRRWASTWEFQALLKARPAAGDLDLGRRYQDVIAPMVWTAAERPDFVPDVQAMRRRTIANLPSSVAPREIKLGSGGLRDVEFAIQLLQLVHGRGDESLRLSATLPALAALHAGGYVGGDDAISLADAYRFLRSAEHRLQLRRMRRTHLVPEAADELTALARSMGFRPDARGSETEVFQAEWALHAREVRRLHEKLFYRPLLEAVARVPSEALRLTPDEAGRRLAALGFADPAAALRHIEAMTSGLSRRAALQRTLLPVLLSYFADAPDPDAGLLAYRQVSDALGETPWYLRLLRDEGEVASRLAYVLATSRYVAAMLPRAPDALQMLAGDDQLAPRSAAQLQASMVEAVQRQPDAARAVLVVRGLRRHELLRIAFADLLGQLDVIGVCEAISAVTEATLDASLQAAMNAVVADEGLAALPVRIAVIAMGRLGGMEVGYGSDADVMFVYAPVDPAQPGPDDLGLAQRIIARLRAMLSAPSTDPALVVDADLRPEGRDGPLVRSIESYARYYARWSSPWEAQALLRARFVVGDAALGAQFIEMIDPVRYPVAGVSPEQLLEIRRIKGRVDSERLPRGADPATHTKLGRGGLADIEWTVQLLQLCHGAELPRLRTQQTLVAIHAARDAGLLDAEGAAILEDAWRTVTRARNAIMLVRDKAIDQLPSSGPALVGVGRAMGYPPGFDPGQLIDDYRRVTRRARGVVEATFYGTPTSSA